MTKHCVVTYTTGADGRIANRSTILCASKDEAKAMAEVLANGFHHPEVNRRAEACVIGYSTAGRYIIPHDELRYLKDECK